MPVICPMCGTSNEDGLQHCVACGTPLPNTPVTDGSKRTAESSRAKTMLFGKAPTLPEATPSPAPGADTVSTNKTMLGAPPVQMNAEAPPKPAPVPMAKMAEPQTSASPSAPVTPSVQSPRTMLGMPAVDSGEIQAAVESARAKQAAAANPGTAAEPAPTTVDNTTQTAPAPTPDVPAVQPAATERPTAARPPIAHHPAQIPDDDELDDTEAGSNGLSTGLIIGIALAGAALLAVLTFLIVRLLLSGPTEKVPQILASQDGAHLTVVLDLSQEKPGATLNIQGQTIPVTEGRAQFILKRNTLELGTNLVEYHLLYPDGEHRPARFPITIRHRVTHLWDGLNADPPVAKIQLDVLPGHTVTVNGMPCKMEGTVCRHAIPLSDMTEPAGSGTKTELTHMIPFHIVGPDGTTDPGQSTLRIPLTPLEIDRPPDGAVVDSEEITVIGTSEEGVTVTINGEKANATSAGFGKTVSLPTMGKNSLVITAQAPGHAPATRTLNVMRVDSLQPYIESWSTDLDTRFDYPRLSRDTEVHRGKKIRLSGRIININTVRGLTAFLLYVDKGCPTGGRCGVYVTFRGETDAGLESMVDVYGIVDGIRDVDLTGGKTQRLPAIEARFVLEQSRKR